MDSQRCPPDDGSLGRPPDAGGPAASEEDPRTAALRLKAIVETAVDAIITIDETGVIETVNPATERLFGYRADEMVGRNVRMLMPDPFRREHDGYLEAYRRTGEPRIIGIGREVPGLRKDGAELSLELAVSETHLPGRRIFTGILRDVTDRNRAAADLRRAKEEAEAANRSKDQFMAVISHELRTPLNAIVGYTELLASGLGGELSEQQKAFLARISGGSAHLLELIEQVLTFTRGHAQKSEPELERVHLAALLGEAAALLEPAAVAKGLRYRIHVDDADVQAEVDPAMLRRLVLNLLSNAVKFTTSGEVSFSAHVDAGELVMEVRDEGAGIRPENLQRVFEPFFQEDSTLTRQVGGSGLGLSVVKQLVEGPLAGSIAVRSRPAEGSTFTVRLPLEGALEPPGRTSPARA